MATSPKPIYSQGFNFSSFMQKGVDLRTGQYTCTIGIFEAPSYTKNCPQLSLSLDFNPLNTEDVGLGQGWSFSLPCYEHRQGTVVLSTKESFHVTETSSVLSVDDQKLKSFQMEKLQQAGFYQITYKSGLVEVFSNVNRSYNRSVLVELYSHTGHSLSFSWQRFGEQPRLQKVLQGSEVLLEIEYGTAHVNIIRAPNTSEASTFAITRVNNQLRELRLPLAGAPSWEFIYHEYGGMLYMNQITSPSGSVENVQYKEQGHRLPEGAPLQSIPYVISHTAHPGVGQPPIRTLYNYSDKNFLAYGGSHQWRDGEDNLYRSPDDYEYWSIVQIEGGDQTKHRYNKFHLMISSEQQNGTKKVTQTTTYHALPFTSFKDQPAQYQLPKTVETTYQDISSKEYRKETSQHVFDEWGNPTEDIQTNNVKITRIYYPSTGENGSGTSVNCPPDPHGFQRYIKTETVTPAFSSHAAPTRSENYVYSQIRTKTGEKAAYFVAVRQRQTLEASNELTTTDYTHVDQPSERDHGRLKKEVTRLLGQYPTTKDWIYAYPSSGRLMQTVTTKSFDGSTLAEETGYSLWSGLVLTRKNEAGIIKEFSYDNLGRIVKTTTSPGTPYQTELLNEYTFLGLNNGYQEAVTDAKGVVTRYITDGLERLCRIEKQDVDTEEKPFRLIQEHSYNAQGQRSETAEIDWFRAEDGREPMEQRSSNSMEYDGWGNVYKMTESGGLVTISLTDPISHTKTEGIEGEGTVKTQLNIFGSPSQVALHNANENSTLYSKVSFTYDGLGRLVNQKDHLGRATEYKHDSFDRIKEIIWPSNRVVKTQYSSHTTAALPKSMELNGSTVGEQSVDGLGRLTSRQIGARTISQSYQNISPEPHEITNSKGDKSSMEYEPALNYVPTRLAGSHRVDDYQYDPRTGALSQSRSSYSTHDLQYLPSGLLSQENIKINGDQSFSAHYTYSMAGKLQKYIDVHGQTQKIHYDVLGRPQILEQGKLKVSIIYDKASRVSETEVKDENNSTKITTSLAYDDFGREVKRSVYKGEKILLYHLTLTYNELSLVATRLQEDDKGVLRDESFEYDSHNRLIKYECQGGQPPTDERGNSIRTQEYIFDDYDNIVESCTVFQDGSQNTAAHSFSEEDPTQLIQITNTHSDFPSKVVLRYDANGCLTQDEQGRRLEYSGESRLTAVRDANDKILAQYEYDATGKLVSQRVPDQPDTHLFYRGDSLIAAKRGDREVSYLSNGSEYWGETVSSASDVNATTQTNLWALDGQNSILATLNTDHPEQTDHHQYTPYGFSNTADGASSSLGSIGFNGEWLDPVTGWYHLGNGYRVYNPILMRFHTPDPWSPFTSGEINPYAYCLGDPINRVDPSGHWGFFGKFGWRDLIVGVLGLVVSVGVGVLTAGLSTAIQVGLSVAVGIASDVIHGAFADAVLGNEITGKSVGMDALGGVIGGLAGAAGGQALKSGFSYVKSVSKSAARIMSGGILGGTTKSVGKAVQKGMWASAKSSFRGFIRGLGPAQVASRGVAHLVTKAQEADQSETQQTSKTQSFGFNTASGGAWNKPLGRLGPDQVGVPTFYLDRTSFRARDVIRPAVKDGDDPLAGATSSTQNLASLSSYGIGTRLGQLAVASMLNRDVRFMFIGSSRDENSEEQ
ncbi:RHS repeat protein [Trichoderma barbatum]